MEVNYNLESTQNTNIFSLLLVQKIQMNLNVRT